MKKIFSFLMAAMMLNSAAQTVVLAQNDIVAKESVVLEQKAEHEHEQEAADEAADAKEEAELAASVTASGTCGDNLTWTLYDDGELVIEGEGEMYDYDYDSNRAPWFVYRESLKKITFGDGVTSVGSFAFYYGSSAYNSPNITSVDFANVSSIGNNAFESCTGLTSVDFANVSSIGGWTFYGCTGLTSVIIPESVKSIDNAPFAGCTSLKSITVAENNENYCSVDGVLFNKNKTTLIQYPAGNTAASYTVPETVSSIGYSAFLNCTGLTSVDFANVSSIGNWAFAYCTGLTSVDFANVSSIGEYAFYKCTGLTSLDFANVSSIESWAFESCEGLTSLNFANVSSIEKYAFNRCIGLTSVDFANVSSIGNYAFQSCTGLTSVDFANVSSIGDHAFMNCTGLTSVVISESVKSIGDRVFQSCLNLKKVTVYSKDVTYGTKVFDNCHADLTLYGYTGSTTETYAEEYDIPFVALDEREILASGTCGDNLTWTLYDDGELVIDGEGEMYNYSIYSSSNYAPWFDYRECLKKITFGDGVMSVGTYAFYYGSTYYSSNITSVDFANVSSIGVWAFQSCTGLTSVDFANVSSIGNSTFLNCTGLTSVDFADVSSIGTQAFFGCTGLTSVVIPESVKSIGYGPFAGCTSLKSITVAENNENYCSVDGILFNKNKTTLIQYPAGNTAASYTVPGTVSSIGIEAFYNCTGLTSVDFANVASIGQSAFENCTGLTSVDFANVSSIGVRAFQSCTGLTSVDFANVSSIGNSAFAYCTGLTELDFANVSSIGVLAFQSCTGLTELDFANVSSIEPGAFEYCTGLTELDFANVSSIGNSAFEYCAGLTSVDFANVSFIGDSAFSDCTDLTSVDFANVSSIGNGAFADCTGLTSVDFANVSSIGDSAFSDCTGLTSVVIPESVKSIVDYAFGYCSNLAKVTVYSRDVSYVGSDVFYGCHADLTLYGYTGSTTEAYAEEYGIPFVALAEREILASGTCGDNLTWTLYDDGELVIDGEGEMYDYGNSSTDRAPWFDYRESLKKITFGDGVASVGSCAFYYGSSSYTSPNITSVDFANVSSIGDFAFEYCTGLTSVDFANVSSIGDVAFYNCAGLTSVDFANVSSIGYGAFAYCSNLAKVTVYSRDVSYDGSYVFDGCHADLTLYGYTGSTTEAYAEKYGIPFVALDEREIIASGTCGDNLTWTLYDDGELVIEGEGEMYDYSTSFTSRAPWFYYRGSLKKITFGDGVTSVGTYAFYYGSTYYSSNITSVDFTNVSSIGDYAFAHCTGLTSVDFANVSSIGDYAFWDCTRLKELDFANVSSIGDYAFWDCTGLTSVDFANVSSIESWAFRGCTGLTSVDFADVSSIGDSAFYNCTGLTSVVIPESVKSIGYGPFAGCTSLKSITVAENNENYCSVDGVLFNKNKTTLIQYPAGNTAASYTVPGTVSSIGYYAFYYCTGLTSVDFANVSSIGWYAFYNCTGLTSVDFANVSSIGAYAFYKCTGLTSVDFANVSSIGGYAFYKCTGLTSVDFANVSSIGAQAFYKCTGLTSVDFANVSSIGSSAFYDCTGLTSVDFANVSSIESWAFAYCTGLTSVVIPESVKGIGNYAFGYCSNLAKVTVYSKDVTYGTNVFNNCHADLTLYGYTGSTTEAYALENDIPFVPLDENVKILFNSGRSDTKGVYYKSNANFDDTSVNNGGYDIYSNANLEEISRVRLGLSFYVDSTPETDPTLSINAFDVDEESGERDYIFLVDETDGSQHKLEGYLSGMHQEWNNTSFDVPASYLEAGHTYHFELYESRSGWVVWVRNVSLQYDMSPLINDAQLTAEINSDGEIMTTLSVQFGTVANNMQLGIEYSAEHAKKQYGSCLSVMEAAAGVGKTNSQTLYFDLVSGAPNGTYEITAYIKDEDKNVIATVTTTAEYVRDTYTVKYDANGGTDAPEEQIKEKDEDLKLSEEIPKYEGYTFAGWSLSKAGKVAYKPGDIYSENADVTLYAAWDEVPIVFPQPETYSYYLFDSGSKVTRPSTHNNPDTASLTNGGKDIYITYNAVERLGRSFTVESAPTDNALLTIYSYDIDENTLASGNERDILYLVDMTTGTEKKLEGYLHGVNEQWNTSTFSIAPEYFTAGHEYYFKAHESVSGWHCWVRLVSIQLSGLVPPLTDVDFTAEISKEGLVTTHLNVSADDEKAFDLEYSAVYEHNQYGSAFSDITTVKNETVRKDVNFNLAKDAPAGYYTIEVFFKEADGKPVSAFSVTALYKCASHKFEWSIVKEPTCTDPGEKQASCASCGEVIESAYISPLGHKMTQTVTKEATCTEDGIITHSCTRTGCDYSYTDTVAAKHTIEKIGTIESTCTEPGKITYACSKCPYGYFEMILPAGHNYIAVETKAPSIGVEGLITYTCSRCNASYTETIPALGEGHHVLLVQERIPWDHNSNKVLLDHLAEQGYIAGWATTTANKLADKDLSIYSVIMIANEQTDRTYDDLADADSVISDYVKNGGIVIYGACDMGWCGSSFSHALPEGVTKVHSYEHHNYISDEGHPVVTGQLTDNMPLSNKLLYGTLCSHSSFSNIPDDANVILTDGSAKPTLVEYPIGDGHVIASGLTWEFYYKYHSCPDNSVIGTYANSVYDDLVVYALSLYDSKPCEHAYDEGTMIAPTCTEIGYTLHVCELCGREMKDNIVDALGHDFGDWITEKEASYTESGKRYKECSRCHEKITEAIPVIPHDHEYSSEWTLVSEPTCVLGGTESNTCKLCNKTITRYTDPLGHDYNIDEIVDPDCTTEGYIRYICSRCKGTKNEVIPATGHDFGDDNICDICGYIIPGKCKHEDMAKDVIAPTCTDIGYTLYSCICGYSYKTDVIEQLGHSYDEGKVITEKTCTTNGIMEYTCTRGSCGYSYRVSIPACHNWTEEITKAKTCTEDGIMRRYCPDCKAEEYVIIPAGHEWDNGIETLAPTCTEPGTKVCTCTVCGTTEEFGIKALGHNFVNGICTRCGIYYIDIIGPSAGASRYSLYFVFDELRSAYGESPVDEYGAYLHHNDGAKFDKVAVYLIQDGTMWRRCIAAKGSNITSAIFVPYLANDAQIKYSGLNSPMINNFPLSKGGDGIWKYSNYATIGANLEDSNGNLILDLADIGIAGKETRVFDDLNEMIKWLNGGCYPHDWDEGKVIKEPTEFNAGFMLYTCKNCGATKQVAIAPKHTHTWDAGKVIKPATETETGIMRYTCTAEGCGSTNDVVIPIIKPIDPPDPNRELIDQGKCGENLVWYLYEDGELEIAGYGEMYDYGFSEAPWYMYASMINKLTIGNKVTTIGNAAFWSCDAIKTVHIGDSLGYIGSLAFNGATAIEKYYVSENNATYSVDNFSKTEGEEYGALMSKDKTELVLYPAGCTKLVYHAPESVEKVSEWAFAQSKLRAVNLPGIKAVGMQAFFRCTALTSVVLGKDLEFLGTYCFYGCSALKAISIPSKTTSIGDSTFAYCTSLDQVIIPTSVSTIDANAFNNSANVTIWCYTGSTAHKYAVAYSIPYVIMNGMIRIKAAAVNNLAIVFENVNNEFVGAVKGIEEGVLCSEVLNDLSSPAESQTLIVTDESGNKIENTEIGVKTGYKVKAVNEVNNVVQEVLLVVEGDVNGDGVVNLADVNAASKEIRVLKEAEEATAQLAEEEAAKTYLIAADLDNDGSVSNEDMKSFLAIASGFAVAK